MPPQDSNGHRALAQALRDAGLTTTDAPHFGPMEGGVSSDIILVEEPGRRFVVKRALAKLRVKDDWFADVGRNRVEQRYLEYASRIAPLAFPRVLGAGDDGGWFAMEYLENFSTWKKCLMEGTVVSQHARWAGSILGRIHGASWGDPAAQTAFATLANFRALRIEPYLLATAARVLSARAELTAEAERLAATGLALVHGDFSPKNLMAGDDRMVVLDAECAWYGDPAFDVAFLANHLCLKALLLPASAGLLLGLIPEFWSAYAREMGGRADRDLDMRSGRLLLCLMLARVHGTSPVEYLTLPFQRDRVTAFAAAGLRQAPQGLEAVVSAWADALKSP